MKVDNTVIIEKLASVYTRLQAAEKFVVGFPVENVVYYAEIPLQVILSNFVGISMTSDETPCKRLRLKPLTKKTLVMFQSYSPKMLCGFDELQNTAKQNFAGNCGQCFEHMICQEYGGKLAEKSSPFWKSGDFNANDIEYQVKFMLATIITEYTAEQAIKECGIKV